MQTLVLSIPDFRSMSDEGVRSHSLVGGMDGRWSNLTQHLQRVFETDRLELNQGWADTWQGWGCPACGRRKIDIARVTDQGVLLCQLDLHHDHLRGAASDQFLDVLASDLPDEVKQMRRTAFAACSPLIERFGETLVCNDCNAADGMMKNLLAGSIPPHFSFSPVEIRQFIEPRPNEPHEPDPVIAYEILLNVRPQYEDRLAFAATMARRIAGGRHDREQHLVGARPREHAHMLAALADELPIRNRPPNLREMLSDRSRSTDGRSSNRSARRTVRVRVPSLAEFEALDARQAPTSPWRRAGSDWVCPGCSRSKFEIMRISNKGTWVAQIMTFNDFRAEQDPESLQRRYAKAPLPLILGDRISLLICHDCRQISTDALTAKIGSEPYCLRIEDIREFAADAQPHDRFPVAPQVIAARVNENAGWITAVKDFLLHKQEADDVYMTHLSAMYRQNLGHEEAKAIVIPRLVLEGKLPEEDAVASFDWLMRERRRLAVD